MEENIYQVWHEGYRATGESGGANLMGESKGYTFKEACDKLLKYDIYYDSERNTYWGCRLFDNEEDARKSFG